MTHSTAIEKKSKLARMLLRIFDETNLYSREQWAEILDVSEAAISQWVNDRTIPRPEILRMVVDTIEQDSAVPHALLDDFRALAVLPAAKISPHAPRIGKTLGEYLVAPVLEGFLRTLRAVTPQ